MRDSLNKVVLLKLAILLSEGLRLFLDIETEVAFRKAIDFLHSDFPAFLN